MQIFHRSTNTLSRATIFGAVFVVAALFWSMAQIQRSPYVTYAGVAKPQPVPFSHQHHVTGLGIDCRYCHTSVETSSFAGIPPTKTCMNCHSQIWTNAALLEPVRESYRSDKSLEWTRVNQLPAVASDADVRIGGARAPGRGQRRIGQRLPVLDRDRGQAAGPLAHAGSNAGHPRQTGGQAGQMDEVSPFHVLGASEKGTL